MLRLANTEEIARWDSLLSAWPNTHFLQGSAWGRFKSQHGWTARHYLLEHPGEKKILPLLFFKKRLWPLGPFLLYLPKVGALPRPLLDKLVKKIKAELLAKESAAVIKFESENPASDKAASTLFVEQGFLLSQTHPQFRRTQWIDLTQDEEALLASFKPKTRYNIRLAERKEVRVKAANNPNDLQTFYNMYKSTASRQHFPVREFTYYEQLYDEMAQDNAVQLLLARHEETVLAGVMLIRSGQRAFYQYGASTPQSRELMPTYLLQWEAMRWAKSAGCTLYDMVGLPEVQDQNDPFWGVARFKSGFGGEVVEFVGAQDYVTAPWLRPYWPMVEKRVKQVHWKLFGRVFY